MKVGIVTMHRVDNYGAALQAYATCESIRFLGGTPEIIDYIPNRFIITAIVKCKSRQSKDDFT